MYKIDIARMKTQAETAARLLTAMANAKRLLILCHLLEGEKTVGALAEHVDLAQSALSQHLSKLRAWDFVTTRREGQQIHYALASDEVRAVLETLYGLYCAR